MSRPLGPLWIANSQRFTLLRSNCRGVAKPFVRDKHVGYQTIVKDVKERDDDLAYVGEENTAEERADKWP